MEILGEDELNISDAKEILNKREKDGELVYEQKICLEYMDKIIGKADTKAIVEELSKISILRPRHIALIINIMPDTEDEVNSLFSKEIVNLKKEETNKIIEIIKKYKK
jgi:DNA-directed RNA polymerase subunit F